MICRFRFCCSCVHARRCCLVSSQCNTPAKFRAADHRARSLGEEAQAPSGMGVTSNPNRGSKGLHGSSFFLVHFSGPAESVTPRLRSLEL